MGKPEAPAPSDPVKTAGAQTASNIGTAIAQQQLNNVGQITPDGRLTYEQSGTHSYTDPLNGQTYDIPRYTAVQTLSPEQQAIKDQTDQASQNFATLAANQSGRIDGLLSEPTNTSGLPPRGDAAALRGPNFQRVGSGPNLQTGLGNVGGVQRGLANAGSVQRSVGDTTGMRFDIPGAGQLRRQIGDAGDITRSYNADFSQDRQRVEDALMSRLNPSLQKDRSALEARLASQGIRVGSEAYQSSMDDFGRQSNDARMSAILGAGQEQSRLTGLEAQRAGFENAAQQQAFGQQANRASFVNDVQSRQFAQNAQAAQFGNAAQQQAFGQEAARAGFRNEALQQQYQNQVGATQANNGMEQQRFNADLSRLNAMDQARNQALQEQFAVRNQPINEITALMSGSQVSSPNFVNTNPAQLANTDFAGIQGNYDNAMQQQYQNKMAGWNSLWGGLGGLGGAYLGALK